MEIGVLATLCCRWSHQQCMSSSFEFPTMSTKRPERFGLASYRMNSQKFSNRAEQAPLLLQPLSYRFGPREHAQEILARQFFQVIVRPASPR